MWLLLLVVVVAVSYTHTHTSHLSLSHHVHPNTTADTHGTGNPQSLKQQPLTYIRQVLSLVVNPLLLEKHADLVRREEDTSKRKKREECRNDFGWMGARARAIF